MNKIVTQVIPAYNHEKYIASTIESIINQTYRNIEVIIINDGSVDKTNEIIEKFIPLCKKRFLRFEYISRKNKGLSYTLNQALKWSKGEYFTMIASDDVALPYKIELLVDSLENNENYNIVFGDAIFINSEGKEIVLEYENVFFKTFIEHAIFRRTNIYKGSLDFGSYKSILGGNYLPACSFLGRTFIFKKVGGWNENYIVEDWEMWLKLSKSEKFLFVNKPVAKYRVHSNNTDKILKRQFYLDCLNILKNEKRFAFKSGFSDVYYNSLISNIYVLLVKVHEIKAFLELIKNLYNVKFILFVFKKIYIKFLKILKNINNKK